MGAKILFSIFILCAGCTELPSTPQLNPFVIFEEQNYLYVMPCKVTNTSDFTFKCSQVESSPLNKLFKGWVLVEPGEVQAWRRWSKDIVENYECKKK